MSLRGRLILSFLLILLVVGAGAYDLMQGVDKATTQALGEVLEAQAEDAAREARDLISRRLDDLREMAGTEPGLIDALTRANQEILALGSRAEHEVARRETAWSQGDADLIGAVYQAPTSGRLRLHQSHLQEVRGYPIFLQILVTDRLGGSVAQTSPTAGYLHRDEAWWREAVDHGSFVGILQYHDLAEMAVIDLALRIEDADGDLAGVLHGALALDELLAFAGRFEQDLGAGATLELFDPIATSLHPLARKPEIPQVGDPNHNSVNTFWSSRYSPNGPLLPWLGTILPKMGFEEVVVEGQRLFQAAARSPDFPGEPDGFLTARVRVDRKAATASWSASMSKVLVSAGTILVILVVVATLATLSPLRPLRRTEAVSRRLAEGDLDLEVDARAPGELGRILEALKSAVERGREHIRRVLSSSARVDKVSRHLARTGAQLSQEASDQRKAVDLTLAALESTSASTETLAASADRVSSSVADASASIEEMAASNERVSSSTMELVGAADRTLATMRGIAASIGEVAGHASEAREASERTVREAAAGHLELENMIEGMRRISVSMEVIVEVMGKLDEVSRKVVRTVGFIDEICAQTDLLAVNAAIQAANAGEHGRTFSVVAREIRKLSERSAAAATEISDLIAAVDEEMARAHEVTALGAETSQEGVRLATKAGEALERIGEAAGDVSGMMLEISAATEQQADASMHVLETVESMRDMTQDVERSTREQAQGSHHITVTMAQMAQMALEVSNAAQDQGAESSRIAESLAEIRKASEGHAAAAVSLSQMMEELSKEARLLRAMAGGGPRRDEPAAEEPRPSQGPKPLIEDPSPAGA